MLRPCSKKSKRVMIVELTSFSYLQSALGRARELAQFELFCHLSRIHRQRQICFPKSEGGKPTWQQYHRPPGTKSDGFGRCWPGETTPTFCDVPSFCATTLQRLQESRSEPRRQKSHSRAPRRKFPCSNSMELSAIKRRDEHERFRYSFSK